MRHFSLFLILVASAFGTACDNETIENTAEFEYETIEKEGNRVNLIVTIRYRLKSRLEKKLEREYGRLYRDSLLLPAISVISTKVLTDYSADEIYSYKRDSIEQKIGEQTKTTFSEHGIEVTEFFIRSFKVSDSLMRRLEQEYVTRFQNAMNKCSKAIKGVVTKLDDLNNGNRIVFYEFNIDNKNYEGILSPNEDSKKVSLGDSLVIEYACEDPNFHRLKK